MRPLIVFKGEDGNKLVRVVCHKNDVNHYPELVVEYQREDAMGDKCWQRDRLRTEEIMGQRGTLTEEGFAPLLIASLVQDLLKTKGYQ